MADNIVARRPEAPTNNFFNLRTGPLTALQITDRIVHESGAQGRPKTVDRITAGDPATAVTGVAVAVSATFDCLRAAAAAGCNLVVTYEPVWWSGEDCLDHLKGDALLTAEREFIRAHDLVVFNFHDHWRDRLPDGLATGMAMALAWEHHFADASKPFLFELPPTTLLSLAKELHIKLSDCTMRMVGDPHLRVRTVAASWGNLDHLAAIRLLNGPADVVICGYTHEWETVEYVQDMIAAGDRKSLILLGDLKSVEGGMRYCAEWIKGFVTDIPVTFIPLAEPYWKLDEPPLAPVR
jgi:putative NIF3 family GTP cyclohydrolase 1 type 2